MPFCQDRESYHKTGNSSSLAMSKPSVSTDKKLPAIASRNCRPLNTEIVEYCKLKLPAITRRNYRPLHAEIASHCKQKLPAIEYRICQVLHAEIAGHCKQKLLLAIITDSQFRRSKLCIKYDTANTITVVYLII